MGIAKWRVECKYWKNQNVWVVEFEETVLAFVVHLLNQKVTEAPVASQCYQYLKYHFENNIDHLYSCLKKGQDAESPLGTKRLAREADPEKYPENEREVENFMSVSE